MLFCCYNMIHLYLNYICAHLLISTCETTSCDISNKPNRTVEIMTKRTYYCNNTYELLYYYFVL